MDGAAFTGDFRVRIVWPAWDEGWKLVQKCKDGMTIRRHLLKLRYWPQVHPADQCGTVLDLDWEYIRSLSGLKVGELRIHEEIAGNDNLRAVFFVGDSAVRQPLPMIWILSVLQKKRNDWTRAQLAIFRARRLLVLERFYNVRT